MGNNSWSGYEDVMDKLMEYTPERFNSASEQEKEQMVEEVFQIYRGKNIFPITYYNEEGISEEINKCIKKDVSIEGTVLDIKANQGGSLLRFLMPNFHKVLVRNQAGNSMWDRFYNDHKLKRTIGLLLRYEPPKPIGILRSSRLIGGGVPSNFSPMRAKAIYEKYTPKGGIIYDYACGFGGRMLGALSSKNDYKYFGVEPCEETFNNLNELGKHIERTTNRQGAFKVFKMGSEDFNISLKGEKEFVDFAFSSPPYFDLEVYSDEETQCYNKFPALEEWYEGYVRQTIKNIYSMLKPNSYYAVNIADFNLGSKRVKFVDEWIKISKEEGFVPHEKLTMKLQARRGTGFKDEEGKDVDKQEAIYVFKKK